jgi:hypothetical protein
MLDSYL